MNLFSVKRNSDNKILTITNTNNTIWSSKPAHFPNKREAKDFRDFLNAQVSNPADMCHVSKGPDHKDYKGCSENKGS